MFDLNLRPISLILYFCAWVFVNNKNNILLGQNHQHLKEYIFSISIFSCNRNIQQFMQGQHIEDSFVRLNTQNMFVSRHPDHRKFQHAPITHLSKQDQLAAAYKQFVKTIELKEKKIALQAPQLMKKEMAQHHTSTKNFRSQTKASSSKKILITKDDSLKTYNKENHSQKNLHHRIQKCFTNQGSQLKKQPQKYLRLQLQPVSYFDKKEKIRQFAKPSQKNESKPKQYKTFQETALRAVKLPAEIKLNNFQRTKQQFKPQKAYESGKRLLQKCKKIVKLQPEQENLVMKSFDSRYFGINQERKNYEKIGLELMSKIRQKYWCYETIQNEQVYTNFEAYLVDSSPQTK